MQLRYRGIPYPDYEINETNASNHAESAASGSRQRFVQLSYRGVPYLKDR